MRAHAPQHEPRWLVSRTRRPACFVSSSGSRRSASSARSRTLVRFLLLRNLLSAQFANLLALLLTAIGNTAANRRLTFSVVGRTGVARHQAQGLAVLTLGLGLTSGSLAALHVVSSTPARWVELSILVLANLAATLLRFLLFRAWVFRSHVAGNAAPRQAEREQAASH
jgi:putative flippase GtrA